MEKTGKIVSIILWALIGVSVILSISLIANISDNEQDPNMLNWIGINLFWVYILGIAGTGLAVVFAIYHTLTSKQAAKKGLISVVFLAAVALIAYLLASPEMPKFIGADKFIAEGLTGKTIKLVDTGLIALYIMLAVSVLVFIVSPIIRIVRK
jgi:hypothetical protein